MKINIICIGNIKEKFYTQACEEYLKRFKHKHGEESMLLSQYRALSKDVEILHRRCGYRFKENAQKVLQGGCKQTQLRASVGKRRRAGRIVQNPHLRGLR